MRYQRTHMLTPSRLGRATVDITVTTVTLALHRAHLLMPMASGLLFGVLGGNPVVGQPHDPDPLVAASDSSRCVRSIPVRGHSG
jgi:hypothetical protein